MTTDNTDQGIRGVARSVQTFEDPSQTALVLIDLTKFDAHPDHGFARNMKEVGADLCEYFARVEKETVPNCIQLLEAFRERGGRVVWTRVGGAFNDFGDVQPNLRNNFRTAGTQRGTTEYLELDEFEPLLGEAIVDKVGSSAFTNGNLDAILRHAGVRNVVFCGVVTNACVLLSALGAWDLGYSVRIVDDACASSSDEMHVAGLAVAKWLGCEITQTSDVLAEWNQVGAGVTNGSLAPETS
jgi:nicotinamidase-related amidase